MVLVDLLAIEANRKFVTARGSGKRRVLLVFSSAGK